MDVVTIDMTLFNVFIPCIMYHVSLYAIVSIAHTLHRVHWYVPCLHVLWLFLLLHLPLHLRLVCTN